VSIFAKALINQVSWKAVPVAETQAMRRENQPNRKAKNSFPAVFGVSPEARRNSFAELDGLCCRLQRDTSHAAVRTAVERPDISARRRAGDGLTLLFPLNVCDHRLSLSGYSIHALAPDGLLKLES
jgi:hypothetical protein